METELLMLRLGVEAWCTETRRLREALMTMSDAQPGSEPEARPPTEVQPHPDPAAPGYDPPDDEPTGGEDPRPMEAPPA